MGKLSHKRIAILSDHGFEQSELIEPKNALHEAGATVHIVSPQKDKIKAWNEDNWGVEVKVDVHLADAKPDDYDALLVPGGVMNPDFMRKNQDCVAFVKAFFDAQKPVAAICHGPQLLIETGLLEGRKITSYPSIKTDLINAGALWEDSEVVVDEGLVTSRSPEDIPAFNRSMIEEFAGVQTEA
ncbi:type 1 glutamine amidotransferase domain-containing protein [Pedobacter puniceum]|uniref:DJ-1/PfpI/YhbO family deglycase/protease n=1 Tax=Pedobacter puniceum TaxID=2666136 RepID=A0A7K0FT40_9SPHI|nr:type 1 glutamine amidotransferase domain-containing protein [Pedobacter puniceum]MRX48811.1 DJ-1/PfpI/YhbO family deglycase/protease [Pedobacter puniceum]